MAVAPEQFRIAEMHARHELQPSNHGVDQHHQLTRRRHTDGVADRSSSPEHGVHRRPVSHHTYHGAGHGHVAHRGSVVLQSDHGCVNVVNDNSEQPPSAPVHHSAPAHHSAHGSTHRASAHRSSEQGAVSIHSSITNAHRPRAHTAHSSDQGAGSIHSSITNAHRPRAHTAPYTGVASSTPAEPHQHRTITPVAPARQHSPRQHGSASHSAQHPVHHGYRNSVASSEGQVPPIPFYEVDGLSLPEPTHHVSRHSLGGRPSLISGGQVPSPNDGYGVGVDTAFHVSPHASSLAGLTDQMASSYPGLTSHSEAHVSPHSTSLAGLTNQMASSYPGLASHIASLAPHTHHSRARAQTHDSGAHGVAHAHHAHRRATHDFTEGGSQPSSPGGHSSGHSIHERSHDYGPHEPVSHGEDLGPVPHVHIGGPHVLGAVETYVEAADGLHVSPDVHYSPRHSARSPRSPRQSLTHEGLHFDQGASPTARQVGFAAENSFHSPPASNEQADTRSSGQFNHSPAVTYAEDICPSSEDDQALDFGPLASDQALDFGRLPSEGLNSGPSPSDNAMASE